MATSILRFLGYSSAACAIVNIGRRLFNDPLEKDEGFWKHTAEQHHKHPFSGMHEPYIPTLEQQEFFFKHFTQYAHLLPKSLEEFKEQQALSTPVKIKSLVNCPSKLDFQHAGTIVVGGPPALISSANEQKITYINDTRKPPIAFGSAFHLEWDGQTEAPSSHLPSSFMAQQIFRALFNYESLSSVKKTGEFSWRSLDWVGWLKHPKQWPEGMRVAVAFQRRIFSQEKEIQLQEVAKRCKANEKFYEKLNQELNGELLLPGDGAIIIARTVEEKKALYEMKIGLEKEGRSLKILSKEEMKKLYGFVPPGIEYAKKPHDRVLSPHFMELVAERIKKLGGSVINGTLTTIYVDNPEEGGIVKYKTPNGTKHFVPFSHLVLSLGNQRIVGQDNKPLFDIVSARGVSALAIAYVPEGCELPSVIVCGGTNNATKLSGPIIIQEKDGKTYNGYLLRMTAGACITPNTSDKDSANYDGTAATGLIAAVQKSLDCKIEVLTVYGCNRQVSEHGQSHWISPPVKDQLAPWHILTPRGHHQDKGTYRPSHTRGIVIQMGAGGGGLTQAPAKSPTDLK